MHNGQQYPPQYHAYGAQGPQPASIGHGAPQPYPDPNNNPNNGQPVPGLMPSGQQVTSFTHDPPSHSMIELQRRYRLDVVQQPKRARMCGFGDKVGQALTDICQLR
jgi:hypothetical protein